MRSFRLRSLSQRRIRRRRSRRAVCEAAPRGAALCITDFEQFLEEENRAKLAESLSGAFRQRALLRYSYIHNHAAVLADEIPGAGTLLLTLEIPDTDEVSGSHCGGTRCPVWSFPKASTRRRWRQKFRFTPGQIAAAANRARELSRGGVTPELLHECCYAQVVVGLNTLATPIKPAYSWEDLVLPESEIKLLKSALTHVKYRHKVYTEWGFSKKAAYGRGLSVLFSGPPGTGKTDGGAGHNESASYAAFQGAAFSDSQQVHRRDREDLRRVLPKQKTQTACCSLTRPTHFSASAPRSRTPTTDMRT